MATVRLFAALREAAGVDRVEIAAPDVASLLKEARLRLGDEFSRALDFSKVAVNGTLVDALQGDSTPLKESDEVALLPPVSGG